MCLLSKISLSSNLIPYKSIRKVTKVVGVGDSSVVEPTSQDTQVLRDCGFESL